MGKVQDPPLFTAPGEKWLERIGKCTGRSKLPQFASAVALSFEHASRKILPTGVSCYCQGMGMVESLAGLIPDEESLAAAMVYSAVENGCLDDETIGRALSPQIVALLGATRKMEAVRSMQQEHSIDFSDGKHVEKLRNMLLAMADDIRSILIKLAERICLLRHAKNLPTEERRIIANETKAIYAPLANRLGIGQFKWELEDLSFRYLAPKTYKNIAEQLADKRSKREEYIAKAIAMLKESIAKEEILDCDITGRVKHIFSIWRKMRRKRVSFQEITDMRAVRILVRDVRDCYAVLSLVHSLWQHIPEEFDDYIASPKQNGYRSLHTAVTGPEGKLLEIQIRTRDMHEESEMGVAAHWRYKEEGKNRPDSFLEKRIAWLRKLIERQKEISSDDAFVAEVRTEFLHDRMYVFTPRGEVLDLPMGSTPLDFAYAIHSEVGHRCRGAKVDKRMVPLAYRLNTGDQVEIMTAKEPKPSRDWMIQYKGYVHTSKAKSYIHRWFKKQDFGKNLQEGKSLLERELKRIGVKKVDYAALTKRFHFPDQDRFLASIGSGDLGLMQVLNAVQSQVQFDGAKQYERLALPEKKFSVERNDNVRVHGADDLLTMIAGCCKPVPGDAIIGYITQGRGLSIHRQNCVNIKTLEESHPERVIDADWSDDEKENYPVDIFVKAYRQNNLINDISKEIVDASVQILGIGMKENPKEETVDISIAVNIGNLSSLGRLLAKIGRVKNVIYAVRQ